jgi:hypothetical protein
MAAGAVVKAFPFRGRWTAAGGPEEVGPLAVSLVCVIPPGKTTSSVFRQKRKRFHRKPPSPEGEGYFWMLCQRLDNSEFPSIHHNKKDPSLHTG